ncbi:MAG: hypothetical protein JWO69_1781 [Thermoleophilia bacterium]|jgi:hypothetical protein|nr:hypothetical protein [Thermoleophilia bacterium]
MHEGWEYVVGTYGLIALTLVIWFWMILAKLARQRRERLDG